MYLHIGNNYIVNMDDVIGVFDMENTTINKSGRKFLNAAQESGQVINATEDMPKSYVVTEKRGKRVVYISSLTTHTLLKRAESSKIML